MNNLVEIKDCISIHPQLDRWYLPKGNIYLKEGTEFEVNHNGEWAKAVVEFNNDYCGYCLYLYELEEYRAIRSDVEVKYLLDKNLIQEGGSFVFTQEMKDKGLTCRGRGVKCDVCVSKDICRASTLKSDIFSELNKKLDSKVTYKLNVNKIKTLDDVKNVLDALNIKVTVQEGFTSEKYEKLKPYLGE